jgi:XTP/dITP diphosphohydrolase
MARGFTGDRLVIATHNAGKLREIAELMKPYGVGVVGAGELGLPEPEETGTTFEANAELKALAAAMRSGMPALADDSGVIVAALDGAPGIYSARWAGPERDFDRAMALVEERIAGTRDRRASFVAVLSLAWPDRHIESFRGEVHGTLIWPPRGTQGFGYDPMFVAQGEKLTFGEMDPAKKYAMSHRADAFRKLVAACFRR